MLLHRFDRLLTTMMNYAPVKQDDVPIKGFRKPRSTFNQDKSSVWILFLVFFVSSIAVTRLEETEPFCCCRLAAQVAIEAHPGGPGTFRAHFLDALYALGQETVTQGALVSEDPL